VQVVGERLVYIQQLHGKGTISNLHKHFIQSCTVRGKSLPVGQMSWWRDNKPSNHTSMHSHSKHRMNTFCVSSYKAYQTPFSNVKCWSYSTVHWLYGSVSRKRMMKLGEADTNNQPSCIILFWSHNE